MEYGLNVRRSETKTQSNGKFSALKYEEVNVTGLQCTQAVMAVLREIVSMEQEEEMHITYEEPNARRDILAMVKENNLVKDETKLLVITK